MCQPQQELGKTEIKRCSFTILVVQDVEQAVSYMKGLAQSPS